jgi:hypothetical protein
MQPQNSCRQNCKTRLTEEVRNTIFTEFWKTDNHDTKVAYVAPTTVRRKRKIESNRT